MKRTLTLKTERLVALTDTELHDVVGAEASLACLTENVVCYNVRTLRYCLTGNYSIPC